MGLSTLTVCVRAVADEHALALVAASKAALPRRDIAEVRDMYLSPKVTLCLDDA
jgi:hypothetical protein